MYSSMISVSTNFVLTENRTLSQAFRQYRLPSPNFCLQPNYTSEIVITVRPYSENSKVLYTNNPLILTRAHILLMK